MNMMPRARMCQQWLRTSLVFFLLILSLFFPASIAFAALGPNLVSNPSLETGTTSPTGWSAVKGGSTATSFSYPVAGIVGARAALVKTTSYSNGDYYWQPSNASVTAGQNYQFSGYSKSTVPVPVIATYINANGATTYAFLGTAAGSNTWQLFSATVTIPTGVVSARIQHVLQATGSMAVDNYAIQLVTPDTAPLPTCSLSANPASIQAGNAATLTFTSTNATGGNINNGVGVVGTSGTISVSPTVTTVYTGTFNGAGTTTVTCAATVTVIAVSAANLIQNGNFETADPNSTSIPLGWNANVWDGTATFTYPVAGNGGGKAISLTATSMNPSGSGGAIWTFPHVTASSNTIYQYTNDYLSDVTSYVTIEFSNTNGSYSYKWINQPAVAVGTWAHQVINITVPSTAKSFTVMHGVSKNGSLTIDNVSLVAMPASPFPNGMVTLLFDDGYSSQYNTAVPMLKSAQLKATFAIITNAPATGDPAYMSWAQILDLQASGFEIASHSRSHAAITELSSTAAQQEIQGSYADLAAKGISATTFVYPYGDVNPGVEQTVKNSGYIGARGSYFGLNAPFGDRYAAYDIGLNSVTQFADIKSFIDQAITDKRWVILEFHNVLATGGDVYSITPSMMQNIVNYINSSGIQTVTLDQGIRKMNP